MIANQVQHQIEISSVRKSFGSKFEIGVDSLAIPKGEVFCLAGPSGSGKSTLLGLIGGWVAPDAGKITLAGVDVTSAPPNQRPIRACFQKGGFLFPHLSVAQNVAFSLYAAKVDKQTIAKAVEEVLKRVGLEGFETRSINSLSGGEAQRISLARALAAPQPILLLDEVTAGLDVELKQRILVLIEQAIEQLNLTVVCVTHNIGEAFQLCHRFNSRMGVMSNGKLIQVDPPQQLYDRPHSPLVATLTGTANLLPITRIEAEYVTVGVTTKIPIRAPMEGGRTWLFCRPERLTLSPPVDSGLYVVNGTVSEVIPAGPINQVSIDVGGCIFTVMSIGHAPIPVVGHQCSLGIDLRHVSIF